MSVTTVCSSVDVDDPGLLHGWKRELPASIGAYIGRMDSFYFGTADVGGQPYIQHRGGPPGFLRVLDRHTLAFADFSGNRQYVTVGHLAANPKAFLFLMDYERRQRVKIFGRRACDAGSGHPPRNGGRRLRCRCRARDRVQGTRVDGQLPAAHSAALPGGVGHRADRGIARARGRAGSGERAVARNYALMNSSRPPSQRSRCACAAAGSLCSSASASSRACSISAASRLEVGEAQQRQARLPRAEEFARAADAQVGTRDLEAVGLLEDHLEPRLGGVRQRLLEQQDARALRGAAPDAPAQLMQLRQPEALGVLDHHDRRVGHVHADLDDGRRDQHVDVAARRTRPSSPPSRPASSGRAAGRLRSTIGVGSHKRRRELLVQRHGRLQFELLRLLDQRAHPVRLAALPHTPCRPTR